MPVPESEPGYRRNSFDIVRLCAALAVAFGHQREFGGYPEPTLGPLRISIANMGLFAFFALSGYLVFQSLQRDPRPNRFIGARLRRIYPGAMANAVFCVLVGSAISTLSLSAYWHDPATWSYLFHSLAIVVTPTRFVLPGVFNLARWPDVDTPIWTLKYELLCYAMLLMVHRFAMARFGARRTLASIAALLVAGTMMSFALNSLPDPNTFYACYNAFNLLRFGMIFAAGAYMAAAEDGNECCRQMPVLVAIALTVVPSVEAMNRVGFILLFSLAVIQIGRSPLLFSAAYRRFGDLSFGFYLYAYPIGQLTMLVVGDRLPFWQETILVFAFTFLAAAASWLLVEQPSQTARRDASSDVVGPSIGRAL